MPFPIPTINYLLVLKEGRQMHTFLVDAPLLAPVTIATLFAKSGGVYVSICLGDTALNASVKLLIDACSNTTIANRFFMVILARQSQQA